VQSSKNVAIVEPTSGGSIKDRIAVTMVDAAEKNGKLKKGGTIVEPTSGNTGAGLAMVAAVKGYQSVFVMPDKMSLEKRNLLRAYGAKVVITPTAVGPDDERSYYKTSDRLANEAYGGFKPNQYENMANPQAHFETTGPEIWEATEGKVTHVVIGMGTGGTISGIGKYLKSKNPKIKIIGVDPVGSVYKEFSKSRKIPKLFKTYKVEGVGEDFIPGTIDFSVIDDVVVIGDKESFVTARRLAREEGILAGGSSGLALCGAIQVIKKIKKGLVVVVLPDSGRNYLSKFYNDDWMKDFGFLDEGEESIAKLLNKKLHFISVDESETPHKAITLMRKNQISQMPVVKGDNVVGFVSELLLLKNLYDKEKIPVTVAEIMDKDVIFIPKNSSIRELATALTRREMVVITDEKGKAIDILTRIDFLGQVG
jgi:cystathionine beta-synthase